MGEPRSKKLKGIGERDTLLFCAEKFTDRKGYFDVDWHTLNLETRQISDVLISMPPQVSEGFSAVACRNHVYVLGGSCSMVPSCPDGETRQIHSHDHVFCFDPDHPEHGWKDAPRMSVPRRRSVAVAAEGKIYAFMGSDLAHFGDVFDVRGSAWKPLTHPSDVDMVPHGLSFPVLYDSPRSRILVHFRTGKFPLYAYYVDDESWECLNEDFGLWPYVAVLVDGVIYCLMFSDSETGLFSLSDQCCSLEAYDLVENKWLPVSWFSKFPVLVPDLAHVYHLGNGVLCFVWYDTNEDQFQYTKISVRYDSGEIYATGLSEPVVSVPFQEANCVFTCLK